MSYIGKSNAADSALDDDHQLDTTDEFNVSMMTMIHLKKIIGDPAHYPSLQFLYMAHSAWAETKPAAASE